MDEDANDFELILRRAENGDQDALGLAFERFRDGLKKAVRLRLDPRLGKRVDPSDVVQEVYLDASRRLPEFVANKSMPLLLWIRLLAHQRTVDLYRQHLGVTARDVSKEVSLDSPHSRHASSIWIAQHLLDQRESPSSAAIRGEIRQQLQSALDDMEPLDQEILAMRHFELLSNQQIAEFLGITKAAASNRYMRALKRLKAILAPSEE